MNEILLRTMEGLLLKIAINAGGVDAYQATLHMRPNNLYRRAGIRVGKEVARTWSDRPPRIYIPLEDEPAPTDRSVFLGTAMFSVRIDDAEKLSAWLADNAKAAA